MRKADSRKCIYFSTISQNKLPLFRAKNRVTTSKDKLKMAALKENCKLFSSVYVSCQSREGDIDDFFTWKPFLPAFYF